MAINICSAGWTQVPEKGQLTGGLDNCGERKALKIKKRHGYWMRWQNHKANTNTNRDERV